MALYSIRNERDLIVINALPTETSAAAFTTSASAGEGTIYNQFGAAVAGKEKFAFYVKHLDGRVRKSDTIDPDKIISMKYVDTVSEVLPKVEVVIPTVAVGDLIEMNVRIWNDGSLGRDDVVFLNGSYSAIATTAADAAAGLVASLNAGQTRMGQTWFTISANSATVTLQSIKLPFVTGKKDGRALDFVVKTTIVNPSTLALTSVTSTTYTGYVPNPASNQYIQDLEWQTRGAFGDSLRGLAYPFDFALQSDVVSGNTYNLFEIAFYDGDQFNHAVQKSPRHLTIAVNDSGTNVANVAALIAKARQVIDLSTAATDTQVLGWTDALGTYHPEDDATGA